MGIFGRQSVSGVQGIPHGVGGPFCGQFGFLGIPSLFGVLSLVHLVHVLGLVCVACHLAVRWCGVPDGGCSRADSRCPPLRGAPRCLLSPGWCHLGWLLRVPVWDTYPRRLSGVLVHPALGLWVP